MKDPRIYNPLVVANILYSETGTLGGTEMDDEDVEEIYHKMVDISTGLPDEFEGIPTIEDVIKALKFLGVKYEVRL